MAVNLISSIMILLFLAGGCSYQGSHFGVKKQAVFVPKEFRQTQEAVERAENSPGAEYCPEKVAQAREKAKEGVELYWSCPWMDCSQRAMVVLAEARKLAQEAESCHPSPPAPTPAPLALKSTPVASEPAPPTPEPTTPTAPEPVSQAIEPGFPAPEPASPAAEPTWIEEPVSEKKVVTLEGIYFLFDSYRLTPEAVAILDQQAVILKEHPETKVEVGGHTDSIGTISYNLALSKRRARAVRSYLISKGISRERLMVKAHGASRPVASNETEEGRAKNSRVELNVLELPTVERNDYNWFQNPLSCLTGK